MVGYKVNQKGFVDFIMVTMLLLISLIIPVLVDISDAVLSNSTAVKSQLFLQSADDAKYIFVRYFHDNPDSVVSSTTVSCGKIYIPPSSNPASQIIQKDPWGREVEYQKWDLRTNTPPESELIIRFVSAGADGTIETTSDSSCAVSDICYEIYNCQMDQLVTSYEVKNGS